VERETLWAFVPRASQGRGGRHGFLFQQEYCPTLLSEVEYTDTVVDRLSGLWGAQTPLGTWLEENQMTTLFFGGVNSDQCVVRIFLDIDNRLLETNNTCSGERSWMLITR
jgi:nicotinamidase-related amidase